MGSRSVEGGVLRVRSGPSRDSIIWQIRSAMEEGHPPIRDLLIDSRELVHAKEQLPTVLIEERAFEIAGCGFRRCAVLAANVPLHRALAGYFVEAARKAGIECRLCLDEGEAEGWLGRTRAAAEA